MSFPIYATAEAYSSNPGVVERQTGSLNGVTAVTVVGSSTAAPPVLGDRPGEGRIRQVVAVSVPNNTGGALSINLYLNDGLGGAATLIDHLAVLASGATYSSAARLPIILLRDYDYLSMTTTAAAVPNYYSVWTEGNALVIGSAVIG